MKRFWLCLTLLLVSQPALAGDDDAPYYGPMKRWHGIGYKFGYEERTEKDGSWRIDTVVHGHGDAIDLALYRAAELARDGGYPYVFLLGGFGSRSPGIDAATLYAGPSRDAAPPTGCRSRKVTTCYTASVAELLRILGGPDGTQPGVPIVDHLDAYGRSVSYSGYGTGGVAAAVPNAVVRSHVETIGDGRAAIDPAPAQLMSATAAAPSPVPLPRPANAVAISVPAGTAIATVGAGSSDAHARFRQALKAAQPVHRRDPQLGWTVSD